MENCGTSKNPTSPGPSGYVAIPKPWLVNLANDPGEEHDLSAEHPDKVKELQAAWDAWNSQLSEPGWLN